MIAYSAGLATPFVGAVIYKTGTKFLGYFVKKEGTQYILEARLLTESTEDWVKISKDIPVTDGNIAKAKADLNKSNKLNAVSQSERKLAYEVGLNQVDEIIEFVNGLSPNIKKIHTNLSSAGTPFHFENNTIFYKTFDGQIFGKIENNDFIVTVAKADIPLPNEYLSQSYMTQHLNMINQQGAAFIIRKRDIVNSSYTSMASRKFVGYKPEMENVIQEFNNANHDLNVLIDELDLGNDYFLPDDEVYLVVVKNNPNFTFDIPTGREGGAYVGFWVPGGFTKHGTAEAVLSNSGSFAHNKDWDTFIDFFGGSQNVIKIK